MKALATVLVVVVFSACGGALQQQPQPGTGDDQDNDGIADKDDRCRDAPETWNLFKDDDGCPDDAPRVVKVDSRLGGTWRGIQSVTRASDTAPMMFTTTLLVQTDNGPEPYALMTGLCPGTASIIATHHVEDSIPEMEWSGSLECSPTPFPGCPDPHMVYTSLSASIDGAGGMNVKGHGTWSGCGAAPSKFFMTFTGAK